MDTPSPERFIVASPSNEGSRTTGNDLPDEVWRIIAHYASEGKSSREVAASMSINRTFFNVVLSAKYGEIRWFRLDKRFIRVLERLQDPFIAGYVRNLVVRAWFIDYLFKRDKLFHSTNRRNDWQRAGIPILSRFLQGLFQPKAAEAFPAPGVAHKNFAVRKLMQVSSPKAVVKMLVQAVGGMKNVTQLTFEWRDLPVNEHTSSLLTAARSAFDTSLRKLVLRAEIPKFKELLAITNSNSIMDLAVHFDYQPSVQKRDRYMNKTEKEKETTVSKGSTKSSAITSNDAAIVDLYNVVAPFIARRRAHLHSLSISSSATADLSQFFHALPALSTLRCFHVSISFDKSILSDPTGLIRFLQNVKLTLSRVSFGVEWPESRNDTTGSSHVDSLRLKRANWAAFNDHLLRAYDCVSSLESLHIPFISVAKTLPIIQRSCNTLRSLRLTGHFLSAEEIVALGGVFTHSPFELKHLHIEVAFLDFELVKSLASRFPGIDSLVLVYKTLDLPFDNPQFEHTDVPEWKLSDIHVYDAIWSDQNEYDEHGCPRRDVTFTGNGIENRFWLWIPSLRRAGPRRPNFASK
ncbi:hypothetical protein BDN70DRAFT_873566 [Pholiota conissans]|uniref:Uncharacterized protein n=1 Tax=Pholiota conissans TaxID=109636 RepID=A0A9P6CY55_9AGAR|nr:hypothetical protein BDN70DRAFT_873566 [Pholiota conissans]